MAAKALAPSRTGANTGVSGSTDEIQPVMSITARFMVPKPEKSATMIWFAVTTYGLPDVVTVESAALKFAVLRIQLPGPKFTVSAPPPKFTRPPNLAPGRMVRLSEAAAPLVLNWIAVPPVPMMVPELMTLLLPVALTPLMPPVMAPELVRLAVLATMP